MNIITNIIKNSIKIHVLDMMLENIFNKVLLSFDSIGKEVGIAIHINYDISSTSMYTEIYLFISNNEAIMFKFDRDDPNRIVEIHTLHNLDILYGSTVYITKLGNNEELFYEVMDIIGMEYHVNYFQHQY